AFHARRETERKGRVPVSRDGDAVQGRRHQRRAEGALTEREEAGSQLPPGQGAEIGPGGGGRRDDGDVRLDVSVALVEVLSVDVGRIPRRTRHTDAGGQPS